MATVKYKPLPELDEAGKAKFWSKVASGDAADCWPWTGGMFAKDYGCFPVKRKSYYAHRYALALSTGLDPVGLVVCHRCDNPKCCNPAHLFAGTHQDNSRDMVAKGRGVTAEKPHESRVEWYAEVRQRQAASARKQEAERAEKDRQFDLFLQREFPSLSDKNPAAVALGRKGGAAKVRKGLAMATTEQRKASAVKAWATRRAKATATPSKP